MSQISTEFELKPIKLEPLNKYPLVSVIVSNYNYGRFLPDAVESVLKQTYPHFELIICDDGSADESRTILPALEQRDSRITVLYKENGGQASAWNLAFKQSRGVVISFLDPDDMFLPDKLEKVVTAFAENARTGLVYHRYQPTTADGRPAGLPFPNKLESGWLAEVALQRGGWKDSNTGTSCLCIRREVAEQLFPLPESSLRLGCGDVYIQSVTQFLSELKALPDVLTYYRIHGENPMGTLGPTAASAAAIIEGHQLVFPDIRSFVSDKFGDSLANQLQLEDIPSYVEYLAALYVMSGKPSDGLHGYSHQDLLRHLPNTPRKYVWRGLFLLPSRLSEPALQFWWEQAWWKRYTRPVTSLLRLG